MLPQSQGSRTLVGYGSVDKAGMSGPRSGFECKLQSIHLLPHVDVQRPPPSPCRCPASRADGNGENARDRASHTLGQPRALLSRSPPIASPRIATTAGAYKKAQLGLVEGVPRRHRLIVRLLKQPSIEERVVAEIYTTAAFVPTRPDMFALAILFVCARLAQVCTLVPLMGMLSWFVDNLEAFDEECVGGPDGVLVLFLASVCAVSWCLSTMVCYYRSSANACFVAFVDAIVFGTLIASVFMLRHVPHAHCHILAADHWSRLLSTMCVVLKASWALAILNIVLFFVTAVCAFNNDHHRLGSVRQKAKAAVART
ncbi:hypothetical protein HIM_00939 [Hirsutella minnesotensis 3608]|nr:hypothetical protein HIM_00939 [Hirsutella minnesotensis 3608]